MTTHKKTSTPREYPPVYEKLLPFVFGVIATAIIILLLVSIAVVMGWFPGSR